MRLDDPFNLPEDIASGIDDVSKRSGWNAPRADDYALPTETWREVVARRSRYNEVRANLFAGEVTEVNDLITLNLNIERIARDVIAQSEGPELLRAFWHVMRDVSVLDPTCGSGAFLFAALNILEPLYTACLEGMRGSSMMPKDPSASAAPGILRPSAGYLMKAEAPQRAVLHPQVHSPQQSLRRGHHGRGGGDLQAAPLPEASGPARNL